MNVLIVLNYVFVYTGVYRDIPVECTLLLYISRSYIIRTYLNMLQQSILICQLTWQHCSTHELGAPLVVLGIFCAERDTDVVTFAECYTSVVTFAAEVEYFIFHVSYVVPCWYLVLRYCCYLSSASSNQCHNMHVYLLSCYPAIFDCILHSFAPPLVKLIACI